MTSDQGDLRIFFLEGFTRADVWVWVQAIEDLAKATASPDE